MRALVTGAAGFIGSTLVDALLDAGAEVIGLDAFTANYDAARKRANLEGALRRPGFRLVEGDLRHAPLAPLLEGTTHVVHLAALPGVRASWGEAFRDYAEHNVVGTQRLLEAARASSGLERLVAASSSSVYGMPRTFPTPEEEPPRPLSPYGVTKVATESLLQAYRASFGVPAVALRYFTVYGPRQRPDMGIHRFFEAAREGRPVTIYGDGGQTRDFTFVDDAVRATIAAMTSAAPEAAYNVGGGHRVTLGGLLDSIAEVAGLPVARRHIDAQAGDPRDTSADTARARRDLGYAPATALLDGLRRQWEWQRNSAPAAA
ncbi:MAG TPA: NAD-dependent epimerase/dehydratase family protein [Candidatus Eisenbacteria bacterium]|nr:NAD-dependent epimerase/dehydratase family protein [Candidatus Eisenbacteria bacterium]